MVTAVVLLATLGATDSLFEMIGPAPVTFEMVPAVVVVSRPPVAPSRTVTIPVPPVRRSYPVGTVYVRYCSVCPDGIRLVRDIANYNGLEFVLQETGDNPPILSWDMQGTKWTSSGWPGLNAFIDTYNSSLPSRQATSAGQSPTPITEVRRVLTLLRPQRHETFVDYGCGDGRWLIEATRTYGCRSVGVEIDPEQVAKARQAIADAGLSDQIQIVEGDATVVDVQADVGVAYLYADTLKGLKRKLRKLKRFATYMHKVDDLAMQQSGDAWLWYQPVVVPTQTQRYAYYGGQAYTGPVCSNPRCSMCASIRRQLGW